MNLIFIKWVEPSFPIIRANKIYKSHRLDREGEMTLQLLWQLLMATDTSRVLLLVCFLFDIFFSSDDT